MRSRDLGRFLVRLQRELRVDVPAVVAGAVGELGVAALRAADVVDRLEGQVGPALALAGLGGFLDWKDGRAPATALFGMTHDTSQNPHAEGRHKALYGLTLRTEKDAADKCPPPYRVGY